MNRKRILGSSRSILTLLVLFVCTSVFAQSIETDPLVKAMREELNYNLEQLKQKPIPAYHMSIRLNDTYQVQVSSNFGISIVTEDRSRVLTPQVRVGSPEVDNFKFESQSRNRNSYSSSTQGVRVPFTDGAIMAVRQGIWSETMNRYSIAVNNYNDADHAALYGVRRGKKRRRIGPGQHFSQLPMRQRPRRRNCLVQ